MHLCVKLIHIWRKLLFFAISISPWGLRAMASSDTTSEPNFEGSFSPQGPFEGRLHPNGHMGQHCCLSVATSVGLTLLLECCHLGGATSAGESDKGP